MDCLFALCGGEEEIEPRPIKQRDSTNPKNDDDDFKHDEEEESDSDCCAAWDDREDADEGGEKLEDDAEGDGFMAVKPWIGAIHAPDDAPEVDSSKCDQALELEWVYGYRGHDSWSNLALNAAGSLVYPMAGVGVVYDAKANAQTYFRGHLDDIVCMAQHPTNPNLFATGQVATIVNGRKKFPNIHVWDSSKPDEPSADVLITKAGDRAIRAIGFSPCGRFLASVGSDNNFTLKVWDWENKKMVAEQSTGTDKIHYLTWHPTDSTQFVMVGQKAVWFWTFKNGMLKKSRGKLGKHKRTNYFSAAYNSNGDVLCGGQDGNIYTFKKGTCKKATKVHKGSIYSLYSTEDGIISGGKDGRVVVMDQGLKTIAEAKLPGKGCKVRSICVSDGEMYVGTSRNEVYSMGNYRIPSCSEPLVTGHFDGELWAVAAHPSDPNVFVTVGEDNEVCMWDAAKHACVKRAPLCTEKAARRKRRRRAGTTSSHPANKCARGIAFSPDGEHVAVGTNNGHLRVFDSSLKEVCSHNINKFGKRKVKNQDDNWIQELKYSPDGSTLAVGTHGMVVVLCDVANGYKPQQALKAHNAAVVHIDWSADSSKLRTSCIAYELLFHGVEKNLKKSAQITRSSSLKNEEWSSCTLPFGWAVQGVFGPSQDGTDVNAVDRSPEAAIVATGDDYGNVNLYRYPCIGSGLNGTNAAKKAFTGHSSHVATVRFTCDGTFLLSTGGEDKSIMQWRVVE